MNQHWAARGCWSTSFATVELVQLLVATVAATLIVATFDPQLGLWTAAGLYLLYPGLAGIAAARSTASDAVVAVATLWLSLPLTYLLLALHATPWGWPDWRSVAVAVGYCLFIAGTLFLTLLGVARVARAGGFGHALAAVGVGAIGALIMAAPFAWFALVLIVL